MVQHQATRRRLTRASSSKEQHRLPRHVRLVLTYALEAMQKKRNNSTNEWHRQRCRLDRALPLAAKHH
jgi:hypothetical protein